MGGWMCVCVCGGGGGGGGNLQTPEDSLPGLRLNKDSPFTQSQYLKQLAVQQTFFFFPCVVSERMSGPPKRADTGREFQRGTL